MANPYGVPGYSVAEVAARRARGESFVLLDVREPYELELANLGQGVVHVPLSQLVARRQAALPPVLAEREAEVVVFCHHGQRSSQVAAWLRGLGYTQVFNMDGGIDAWARTIDPSVGFY